VGQTLRGWLQGVVQPMMFSVQAKAVGPHRQGSVVGLRQTMNRLAAIVIPPAMGAVADHWGAGQSFCHFRHRSDCAVHPGYLDHPARDPERNKSCGADLK
jgi:sugar phosphate permease